MNNQSTRFTIFVCIIAVPVVLVIIPIANFFLMSFWKMESNQIVESASFGNYLYFFSSPAYWGTFLSTLYLCLKVSAIGVLVGYPVAYFVWKRKGRVKYLSPGTHLLNKLRILFIRLNSVTGIDPKIGDPF